MRHAVLDRVEKAFFQPVRLGLHAVDQDAPDVRPVQSTSFIDMPRRRVAVRSFSFAGGRVSRRKNLVALSAHRLEPLPAPQGSILGNHPVKRGNIHVSPLFAGAGDSYVNPRWLGASPSRGSNVRILDRNFVYEAM